MPEPKRVCFADVLADVDDGKLLAQLSDQWGKLIKQVRETNKAGDLTLKLSAKMDRGTMCIVTPNVTTKSPTPSVGNALFYTDEEGNTTRHDPKQLNLKVVTPIKRDPS